MSKNYPLKASLNTNSFEKLREMAKVNNDTPSNLLRSILDKLDKGEFDKALEPYQPQKPENDTESTFLFIKLKLSTLILRNMALEIV